MKALFVIAASALVAGCAHEPLTPQEAAAVLMYQQSVNQQNQAAQAENWRNMNSTLARPNQVTPAQPYQAPPVTRCTSRIYNNEVQTTCY